MQKVTHTRFGIDLYVCWNRSYLHSVFGKAPTQQEITLALAASLWVCHWYEVLRISASQAYLLPYRNLSQQSYFPSEGHLIWMADEGKAPDSSRTSSPSECHLCTCKWVAAPLCQPNTSPLPHLLFLVLTNSGGNKEEPAGSFYQPPSNSPPPPPKKKKENKSVYFVPCTTHGQGKSMLWGFSLGSHGYGIWGRDP